MATDNKTKKGEIVKKEANTPSEAELLISRAIDKNVPVETMEKLLAMRRELKQEKAREEFYQSLSKLQMEMPIVKKTKIVKNKDGTERYRFAPIDSIISQTKQAIRDNGFSYMIETVTDDVKLTVTCKVTHEVGHMESSSFVVPIDKSAYMNSQQQFASASTYAKRYAFCNAFGILTGDDDDDTDSVETPKPPVKTYTPANTSTAPAPSETASTGFDFNVMLKKVNGTDNIEELTKIYNETKALVQTEATKKLMEIIVKKGTILRKNETPKPVQDQTVPH